MKSSLLKIITLAAMCATASSCGDDAFPDILDLLPENNQDAGAENPRIKRIFDTCESRCDRQAECDITTEVEPIHCVPECISELREIEGEGMRFCLDRILDLSDCLVSTTSCEEFSAWNTWAEQDGDTPPPPICVPQFLIASEICG